MMQSPDPGLAVAEGESVRALLGLATAFWPGDDRSDAAELQRLVQEGFERGVLNYDEIAAGLEDVELTKEQIEDFYTYLIDHGVELMEGETHKHPPHEQPVLAEEEKGPKLDLTVEPSLDSLRLYLGEIGKVPLKGAKTPVPPGKRGICGHKA